MLPCCFSQIRSSVKMMEESVPAASWVSGTLQGVQRHSSKAPKLLCPIGVMRASSLGPKLCPTDFTHITSTWSNSTGFCEIPTACYSAAKSKLWLCLTPFRAQEKRENIQTSFLTLVEISRNISYLQRKAKSVPVKVHAAFLCVCITILLHCRWPWHLAPFWVITAKWRWGGGRGGRKK